MFIKKVVKTYKGNGNSHTEYRFVRGYRTSVGPRHQTFFTGRDIPLPEDKWKQLTDAIDCILNCEEVVFVESNVMNLADYCHLIRAKHPDLNTKRKSDLPPGQTVRLSELDGVIETGKQVPDQRQLKDSIRTFPKAL